MSFKPDVSLGNVVSWAVMAAGVVATFVWLQADVRYVKDNAARIEARVDRIEGRIEPLKDDIATVKSDIRVIRQILESRPQR